MADVSDVENALVALVSNVIHPAGASGQATIGAPCEIARGWPNKVKLSAALNTGKVMATIYAVPNMERLTTRFQREWQTITPQAVTLTANVVGNTVTIGGAVSAAPQVVAVSTGGLAYTYLVQPTDTLLTIAASLAAAIPGASVPYGSVVYVGFPSKLTAAVSGIGSEMRELRRQERTFQVCLWCPTPAIRDKVGALVDAAFAQISLLAMPDGSAANIKYARTYTTDGEQNENLYRRDIIYAVEYATTQTIVGYGVALQPLTLAQVISGSITQPVIVVPPTPSVAGTPTYYLLGF